MVRPWHAPLANECQAQAEFSGKFDVFTKKMSPFCSAMPFASIVRQSASTALPTSGALVSMKLPPKIVVVFAPRMYWSTSARYEEPLSPVRKASSAGLASGANACGSPHHSTNVRVCGSIGPPPSQSIILNSTSAVAFFDGSARLVATIWNQPASPPEVNNPFASMVFFPLGGAIDQSTLLSAVPVTCAVNWIGGPYWPSVTWAGSIEIWICC